jgi:uncharacterized protein YndB with AHSA1/START domain
MTAALFDYQTILPHPIEDVFTLTVDLQNAPHWHSIFTEVEQLTPNPIGLGSKWRVSYGVGSMTLEITDYQPQNLVAFKGSRAWGMVPNFTITLQAVMAGTQVHYYLHPDIPTLLRPMMAVFAPPYGRRDLDRYFRELDNALIR